MQGFYDRGRAVCELCGVFMTEGELFVPEGGVFMVRADFLRSVRTIYDPCGFCSDPGGSFSGRYRGRAVDSAVFPVFAGK